MINENAFELNDEQLAEVAGGLGDVNVINQFAIDTPIQINIGIAPTIGVAVGGAKLNLAGADLHLGNKLSTRLKNKA